MKPWTLGAIAEQLGCTLAGGDGEIKISGVSTLDRAKSSEITFLSNLRYAAKVKGSEAAAVIAVERLPQARATLISSNPYHDFARALHLFYQATELAPGIHPLASVDTSAVLGPDVSVGPFAVIGPRVTVGRGARIYPHAVIYEGCTIADDFVAHSHVSVREFSRIGNRVILHNGVVIGGDGFGFAKTAEDTQFKIPQTGIVVIEDDVEVQSLSSIDRATIGETRIRRGTKIDSLCQIGHACDVGEDVILCGQVGLAGSTTLGRSVVMAGQTGSAGHLRVGDRAVVWAQSGLHSDVSPDAVVAGSPAYDSREWLRTAAAMPKIADLIRTVRNLERRVVELESERRFRADLEGDANRIADVESPR